MKTSKREINRNSRSLGRQGRWEYTNELGIFWMAQGVIHLEDETGFNRYVGAGENKIDFINEVHEYIEYNNLKKGKEEIWK